MQEQDVAREVERRNQAERIRIRGAYPATCEHPDAFTTTEWWVYGPTEVQSTPAKDWEFARRWLQPGMKLGIEDPGFYDALEVHEKTTAIRLCANCYALLPSEKQQRERRAQPAPSEQEQSETDVAKERVWAGEAVYWCSECSEIREEDELCTVRECPHCEEAFNGSDEGRNCPSCNRPFSRLITENGCSDCLGESECELLTTENWKSLVGEE